MVKQTEHPRRKQLNYDAEQIREKNVNIITREPTSAVLKTHEGWLDSAPTSLSFVFGADEGTSTTLR